LHADSSSLAAEIKTLHDEMRTNNRLVRTLVTEMLVQQRRSDARHIMRAATHVYSQNFEDAIIAEIYSRIGEESRVFVEIGVETGVQCNTRALLERGWTGVWIDGDEQAVEVANENVAPYIASGALKILSLLVTPENARSAILAQIGSKPIDFLSVDVDYHTSNIWRAIDLPHRVACIEYNANYPPTIEWEAPYDPARVWDGTNQYGASLKKLETIGSAKELLLVGCELHGVNAFFVRDDLVGNKFLPPYTAERHFEPPRYELIAPRGHPPRAQV
jgi:hypothetical protein